MVQQQWIRSGTALEDAPEPVSLQGGAVDGEQRARGVRDIVSGLGLIAIGLVMGGSVFTGDPTVLDWIFDGLGTFWVVKGVYQLVKS